jgi:molybdenum cofactor guanylyltransferase
MDKNAQSDIAPLSAAILAGGQSSRMGTDKAMLALNSDALPLIVQTRDRARDVAAEVFVVASNRPAYERFGMQVVPDDFPAGGTLGAIATAVRHARHEHCLVLACDLPFLNLQFLRWMMRQPRDYDVLIPKTRGESRQGGGLIFHTLHAIYSKRCLSPMMAQLETGRRQIIGFFDKVNVCPIEEAQIRRYDPELRTLFNANTPDAFAQAIAWNSER